MYAHQKKKRKVGTEGKYTRTESGGEKKEGPSPSLLRGKKKGKKGGKIIILRKKPVLYSKRGYRNRRERRVLTKGKRNSSPRKNTAKTKEGGEGGKPSYSPTREKEKGGEGERPAWKRGGFLTKD